MLHVKPFVQFVEARQGKSKARLAYKHRHVLESFENRTLLSAVALLPGISIPNHHALSVALVAPQAQAASVPVASSATLAATATPDGYNANDWAKYSAAVANNGLAADEVAWTEIDGEMRLTTVYATNSSLSGALDLSGCTALQTLDCGNTSVPPPPNVPDHYGPNQLTSLNVSGCTALQSLNCDGNQLTSLNLSGCTALQTLFCDYNQLTSLDVSDCKALTWLYCYLNQLTSLNISGGTALEELCCLGNQLPFSTLPLISSLPSDCRYYYDPQNNIPIVSSLVFGSTLDLSKEYKTDGAATAYTWYYADGTVVPQNNYMETNGKFVFLGLKNGDTIYCTMTNAKFPGLTLQTTPVTIGVSAGAIADPTKANGVKSSSSLSTVTLTWNASDKNAEYVVTCTSPLGIASQTVTGDQVVFDGLQAGTSYKFSVVAKNAEGKAAAAVNVSVKTQAYAAVKNVKATGSLASVTLTWNASTLPETTGYEVYRLDGKTETLVWSGRATTAIIDGLTASTKYTFVVRAVADMGDGNSVSSADAKVSVSTAKYAAVTQIKVTSSLSSVTLTWNASPFPETTGYEVFRLDGKTETLIWSGSDITATIEDLISSTKYTFYTFIVRAVSSTLDIQSADAKVLALIIK
ncbi:MAG: fibronectin type III domain-containing protein [Phycisphaerales bacterium]|nr:fibronectin type III domain-containing protein [Phycisphaerales bacterium]